MTENKTKIIAGMEIQEDVLKLRIEKEQLEQENNKLLDVINNQDVKIAELEKENAELRNNGFTVSAMTEQQLKVAIEKGEQLEKKNAEIKADNNARKFAMGMREKVEKQLREQIEKMKCCENCDRFGRNETEQEETICDNCINFSNWELRR